MIAKSAALGELFSAYLDSLENYPRPDVFALLKDVAASSPSPQAIEVAYQLLGPWSGTGMQIPSAPRTFEFPADHGEHWDNPIEWRYITLSLTLETGGLVSVVASFFRKAIASAASAPGTDGIDRQIYSTSIAVTLQLPGAKGVHYALPTTTFAPPEGGVEIGNDPFKMVVGKNSLAGGRDVFPLHTHIEDDGDPAAGRPSIVIDVDSAAKNGLFPQGKDGYVGVTVTPPERPTTVGWFYYSWPQQPTTGSVTIGGQRYAVKSGIAWLDHQWGGSPAPDSAVWPPPTGWCWFEFQFDGGRSLTLACPHGPVVDHKLPPINMGFGTLVEPDGTHQLVGAALEVGGYIASMHTDAQYPAEWTIEVWAAGPKEDPVAPVRTKEGPVFLVVTPTTLVKDQAMWFGSLTEYSEANCTATALGIIDWKPVELTGVGYCEGVNFETPAEYEARAETFLRAQITHI